VAKQRYTYSTDLMKYSLCDAVIAVTRTMGDSFAETVDHGEALMVTCRPTTAAYLRVLFKNAKLESGIATSMPFGRGVRVTISLPKQLTYTR